MAGAPAAPSGVVGAPYPSLGASVPSPSSAWPQAGHANIGLLLQALQQRQIPALPGPYRQPAPVPQLSALNLLSLMLSNPNLHRTLQHAHLTGVPPRSVDLPIPTAVAPLQTRQAQIPLGAVMNALTALAGQAMTELNESTAEDEPEVPSYLVGEDGDFLVDPASADDRAALVAHLFRLSDEIARGGDDDATGEAYAGEDEAEDVEDEQEDSWAEAAGFI
jgi:hypothetical protein